MKKSKIVVSSTTLKSVYSTMKKYSSRKTGKVTLSRTEVAEVVGVHPRTVDNAIALMKRSRTIKKDGQRYIINLKK